MAKSNYLPRILLAGTLCLCGYACSDSIVVSCQLPVVSKRLVQKEIDSPIWKQKDESPKPIAQGSAQKRHQVTGVRNKDQILSGVKSRIPTTDNRQQITNIGQQITDLRFQQRDNYRVTTKRIYDSQIGIREQGINTGTQVEEYLKYVNLKKGQPWCAAFICWVFGQARIENPCSGWSPDLFKGNKLIWDRAESRKLKAKSLSGESGTNLPAGQAGSQDPIAIGSRHSRIAYIYPPSQTTGNRQQTTPKTGDIFGLFFPDKNRIAHAGFIDQWDGTWLITVEGNTNVSGGREGDGVYRKRRLVKSVYQVARYL
ncbi:MAG: hypothetical protein Q8S11_04510 [Daejeonella sp.]|uniref:hypothetical protein n=1 Tax=Daejeonella sp. TaxID=2805397 RepID=UPI002733510C|nr:hypothetical protein [Daejeonella sp.]MDP3467569.1 hypothetical protein [Daejeonella sp.]